MSADEEAAAIAERHGWRLFGKSAETLSGAAEITLEPNVLVVTAADYVCSCDDEEYPATITAHIPWELIDALRARYLKEQP